MIRSIKQVGISACVAALALSAAACSKNKQASETAAQAQSEAESHAARMEETRGGASVTSTMTATVEKVDRANRTVTLREADGDPFTIHVSEDAPIDRIEPNDTVNVAYRGILTFELKDPGSVPKQDETMGAKQIPNGVQNAHRVESTVEILAVGPDGATVTFRDPSGEVRTVDVAQPENRMKVENLRPGDSVTVAFTEQLDVMLEK
jgi:hypothetical protein